MYRANSGWMCSQTSLKLLDFSSITKPSNRISLILLFYETTFKSQRKILSEEKENPSSLAVFWNFDTWNDLRVGKSMSAIGSRSRVIRVVREWRGGWMRSVSQRKVDCKDEGAIHTTTEAVQITGLPANCFQDNFEPFPFRATVANEVLGLATSKSA